MPPASGVALGLDRLVMLAAARRGSTFVQSTPPAFGREEQEPSNDARVSTAPNRAPLAVRRRPGMSASPKLAGSTVATALPSQIHPQNEPIAAPTTDPIAPPSSSMQPLNDAAGAADPIATAPSRCVRLVHRSRPRASSSFVQHLRVLLPLLLRNDQTTAGRLFAEHFDAALAYVRARPEVLEDDRQQQQPFVAGRARLAALVSALARCPRTWRTTTGAAPRTSSRLDMVTPSWSPRWRTPGRRGYESIHAEPPRELTPQHVYALARLADAGITLVSSMLLGVNDDAATLAALMRAFVECRVKPFYLHHGGLATGAAHFRTPIAQGQELMAFRGRAWLCHRLRLERPRRTRIARSTSSARTPLTISYSMKVSSSPHLHARMSGDEDKAFAADRRCAGCVIGSARIDQIDPPRLPTFVAAVRRPAPALLADALKPP